MSSSRETNTMSEGLQRMMADIAKLKTMPDSDLPFLVQLETGILGYLRPPTPEAPAGVGSAPTPGGMGMAGPPPQMGGSMGPAPGQPAIMPPGVPAGGAPSAPQIHPEELIRLLSQRGTR